MFPQKAQIVYMTDTSLFSLKGKLLIATPAMRDPRFAGAVIYICTHDEGHAMGIMINKQKGDLRISDMLDNIGIEGDVTIADTSVLDGGPVDIDRGFVLHSPDFHIEQSTAKLSDTLMLTATKDILESFVSQDAPDRAVLAIGYSGWSSGQIENEIKDNVWLICDADDALIFDQDMDNKWGKALAKLGIAPHYLSGQSGSA